ncbi:interleukin-15 receptor subunit alpha isoform X2 [Sphaeramia orbicularis]|uniref:interleukin-15 receptor subunit alpha isoform X2 n=1 Tax=Sphaeramia orbicularis TaxID=375764 RepID=UPI0011809B44|nr:interleukin-15 receptor subunit alpha isoform X2 [Sphaeramia orbicularis]
MDSGSLPVRWCVKPSFIMVCLLWTVRCSYGDKNNCPCPEIPHLELTEPPTRGCYNISNTFRYKCIDGYVRKAGTSNLVKCKEDQGSVAWTTPKLACIPDPQRITTPSNTPETAPSSTEQMTQSTTISASVSAQTDNMELTSPGLQVPSDYTQAEPVRTSTQPPKSTETTEPVRTSTQPPNSTETIEPVRTSTQPPNSTETTPPTVQRTQSATISASLAAETGRVEQTSPGFQVLSDPTQETRGADQTTKPSILSNTDNSTAAHSHSTSAVVTNVMSAVVAGVIIILLIGIGSFFYRRRTRKIPLHTSDELVPMNTIGS